MKAFGNLIVVGVVVFAGLQLVRPGIPVQPATSELQAPPAIRHILDKSCYSCHSNQRRLSWFDQIVPGYWLVRHDILTAREHLNFSTLGSRPPAAQKAVLYESANFIQLGAMPLPSFLSLHPDAKVSPEDLAMLKAYLAPWKSNPVRPAAAPPAALPAPASLTTVKPELNGLPFDPAFASWKPISITDRGDNHTFRFILGNEVAVHAAQSGHISPWPDGSRFAKIAWEQEVGADGLVQPGNFIQVELMLKDARRYQDTDGWGWGRWRGLDLKPYGESAHFVDECTGCHQPVHGYDYVYTLPITAATVRGNDMVNNGAAALPAGLPYPLLGWGAITMYVDPKTHAMAMLYGNDVGMQAVQARRAAQAGGPTDLQYLPGSVLALVIWEQRDDPHWFGARIPGLPRSVEFVQVPATEKAGSYRRFAGAGLAEDHPASGVAADRTSFILGLAPVRMP